MLSNARPSRRCATSAFSRSYASTSARSVWPGGIDWAPESLHSLLIASNGLLQHSIDDAPDRNGAQIRAMPEISRFFGIVVRMLYNDQTHRI